jgi:hypothetical protein
MRRNPRREVIRAPARLRSKSPANYTQHDKNLASKWTSDNFTGPAISRRLAAFSDQLAAAERSGNASLIKSLAVSVEITANALRRKVRTKKKARVARSKNKPKSRSRRRSGVRSRKAA